MLFRCISTLSFTTSQIIPRFHRKTFLCEEIFPNPLAKEAGGLKRMSRDNPSTLRQLDIYPVGTFFFFFSLSKALLSHTPFPLCQMKSSVWLGQLATSRLLACHCCLNLQGSRLFPWHKWGFFFSLGAEPGPFLSHLLMLTLLSQCL